MLAGKHIWLIGASEGIGEQLASRLAEAGAHLALSARNAEKLEAIVKNLGRDTHLALPLDVTEPHSIGKAYAALSKQWPALDILIYNAGTYTPMRAQGLNLEMAEQIFAVNFTGALRAVHAALPGMIKRKGGHIVLVGSVAGYRGLPNSMAYGASKAALINLAESLRLDVAEAGITVQLVSPGFVHTQLTAKNDFAMPAIISAGQAALHIVKGIQGARFEIHFPKRFTAILKLLRILPYTAYFWLIERFVKKE